jgi:hypothetical protein
MSMIRFLILLAVSFVVYFPSLNGTYLYWDDTTHIINNPHLIEGDWLAFWTKDYYRLYIPVTYTIWTWVYMLSTSGWIYHVFNFMLHAACGVLFMRLLQLALPAVTPAALWLATLAFMLHPLQTEPVAWIAGGRDLLSTYFALWAALVIWRRDDWKGWVGSSVLFLLSLLSKATTAPLPVALLVIPAFRKTMTRAKWICLGLWLVAAAVVIQINKMIQQVETDNMLRPISLVDRLITVVDAFGFYIQKFLVPWPLSGDYGRIPWLVVEKKMYLLPMGLLAALLLVLALIKWRRPQTPLYGFSFFVIIMIPVSGIVSFMAQSQSSVADRYVYLAWAGPCILLAVAITYWPRLKYLTGAVVAVWAGVSFARSHVWVDNTTFFPNMLEYNPESFVGHTTMGVVDFGRGRMDWAEQHFKDGHRLMPLSVSPLGNLAQVYIEQNRMLDILRDIAPAFDAPGFIEFNKTNKASLARCARVIARAHLSQGANADAHRRLCLALVLDPEDRESQADFVRFSSEMQKRGIALPPCPPAPL